MFYNKKTQNLILLDLICDLGMRGAVGEPHKGGKPIIMWKAYQILTWADQCYLLVIFLVEFYGVFLDFLSMKKIYFDNNKLKFYIDITILITIQI